MPTGGKRDIVPPKLVKATPTDSLLNTKPSRIELSFDEYITLSDATKEVQISPLLDINPTVTSTNKKVTIKLPDSLLEENTTYRIAFGNAVKDLHEGNVFANYAFTFSTGPHFDSLSLAGRVLNAASGLPDSSGIVIALYYSTDSDSALVKHRPKYITKVGPDGKYVFKGLPARKFRIFALRDKNENLMYDGIGEGVAFVDNLVQPGDSIVTPDLRLFELPDTALALSGSIPAASFRRGKKETEETKPKFLSYSVNIDTNISRRTFSIDDSIVINFSDKPLINREKITLLKDTGTIQSALSFTLTQNGNNQQLIKLKAALEPNSLYTLRLAKGFGKDSTGADLLPSKYTFRTRQDEDYGKINIHFGEKYANSKHILLVMRDQDTVYKKTITETAVVLNRLEPSAYTFRIIVDKNQNGYWDAGNLLEKRQPEEVVPYFGGPVILKAGWENNVDFDQKSKSGRLSDRGEGKK